MTKLLLIVALALPQQATEDLVVGSKKFTENVILGEAIALLAEARGVRARHRPEIGGTRVLWTALLTGDIDVYPEYTGTLLEEILSGAAPDVEAARDSLRRAGIGMSASLGFNNTYVLGMRRDRAENLGIRAISDLRDHPDLRLGFTNEFMDRADGWPLLRRTYALPHDGVRGLDHDLAYPAIASGSIDVIDLYSTDAEIEAYDILPLEDDRGLFPDYHAVVLYRLDTPPPLIAALEELHGRINESLMVSLNARVRIAGDSEVRAAAALLDSLGIAVDVAERSRTDRILETTGDHLELVLISLLAAILLAIPLGIWAANGRIAGPIILGVVGVIYTIPALALLVFMIPLLGIGGPPAMVALFLYSLLPIVRNTHAGLTGIPTPLRESAAALGLGRWTQLRRIELPLAAPSILAGIKTAAVINVGTATLGALIGAGGYGQPILTGIRLNDVGLILEGAVPAALLALSAQWAFDGLERIAVPRGLRQSSAS